MKEELLASFEEENELLKRIAACEEEIGKATDDAEKMEASLNKLAELQEKANQKGVYSLDSKVILQCDVNENFEDYVLIYLYSGRESHGFHRIFSVRWRRAGEIFQWRVENANRTGKNFVARSKRLAP